MGLACQKCYLKAPTSNIKGEKHIFLDNFNNFEDFNLKIVVFHLKWVSTCHTTGVLESLFIMLCNAMLIATVRF